MANEKNDRRYYGEMLRCNSDDAAFALEPTDIVNGENVRNSTTDAGVTGVVESIGSNVLISQPVPSITYLTIGSKEDTENKRFIKFQYNTIGSEHKIVALYEQAGTNGVEYDVLLSYQVTGGLNFSKDSPIHSAIIVNGFLIWPDSTNNEPRKINIESAIKANNPSFVTDAVPYIFPLNFSEITLIKPPPALAPNINKHTDVTFTNNFIANENFEFAWQFVYYDNETTVTGCYSRASRLNAATDTANAIVINMDSAQVIPSTVRIVNLVVRYDNEINGQPSNIGKTIKTWDKDIAAEAAEIALQNLGTPLQYDFFNNTTGETLAPDDILRPYDVVPIYCEGMEAFRNRVGLANNTEGYDTPLLTSMSVALGNQITLASSSHSTNLISFKARHFPFPPFYAYSGWYLYITWLNPVGYYAITSTEQTILGSFVYPTLPAQPTTVAFSGLTFRGATQADVLNSIKPATYGLANDTDIQTLSALCAVTGTSTAVYNIFAQKMPYRGGIVFYDYAMRKCGVATNNNCMVTTPARGYAYTTAYSSLNWTLSNAAATSEIPSWAFYYAPVRTLNLRTRFFIESFTNAVKYATKDAAGKYVFTSNLLTPAVVGIGLNTAALNQSALGYSFTEGDSCILVKSTGTSYEIPVIGQIDNFIILKAQDIGDLSVASFIYEVYSPYQTSEQEPFFEIGQLYQITDPTLSIRQYSVLFGSFNADAYAISRNYLGTTYFAGTMSPNDLYYKRWDNDGGKPNYITKLGQAVKTQYIRWSDTFIPNTAVNGLSTFRALNQKSIPEDCGAIMKLILTSKVQGEQGTVMLAICAGGETVSLYMQETQLTDSNGNTIGWAQTAEVIGQMNVLKGSKGTINPESVSEYRGNVYWFDANNGQWVQYSLNGLDVISEYKMTRFWNLWAKQYLSMTAAEIEALGGRPFVFSTVDTQHKELLISIPKLSETPPKGYLPDYPNTIFPFDILDFQATTIVYKLGMAQRLPHWQGKYTFYAENFITLNNKLYSFKGGLTFLHNDQNSSNNFYGVQYTSKIMCVANMLPQMNKSYDNIGVQANARPSLVYMLCEYPYMQSSDIVDYEFRDQEGIFVAPIKRNKLSTGVINSGLNTGEKMRNTSMFVMFEFPTTSQFMNLRFVQIGFTISSGNNNFLGK